MTVQEYLDFEATSETKHDYVDGYLVDVRAMAGTTVDHSRIERNWIMALSKRLDGKPCEAFGSSLKVRAAKRTNYRYPDLSVGCKPLQFDDRESTSRTLLNPTLVVEILSDSTGSEDRGQKFTEYREIESFREYVLTSQSAPSVEVFYKRDDGQWLFNFSSGLEASIKLLSLGIEVPLSEIYAGVTFPKPDAAPVDPSTN